MQHRKIILIFPFIGELFPFLILGCAMKGHAVNKPITKIVYSFNDESVPPQYHRSYTITVTKESARLIVNSYDDILADTTIEIPEHTIKDLARYIEVYKIKQKDQKSDTMISIGGASKSLTIYSDDTILFNKAIYQRRGCDEGSLSRSIDSLIQKMKELFPDFENQIK